MLAASGLPKIALTPLDVTKSLVGRLVLGVGFLASGIAWEAPPVILGSIVLLASGIPLWLKARKAERQGGQAEARALDERFERQLIEGEDRDMQQIADIEQNANRIADLEERLEFLERLLARQRNEERGELGPGPQP